MLVRKPIQYTTSPARPKILVPKRTPKVSFVEWVIGDFEELVLDQYEAKNAIVMRLASSGDELCLDNLAGLNVLTILDLQEVGSPGKGLKVELIGALVGALSFPQQSAKYVVQSDGDSALLGKSVDGKLADAWIGKDAQGIQLGQRAGHRRRCLDDRIGCCLRGLMCPRQQKEQDSQAQKYTSFHDISGLDSSL